MSEVSYQHNNEFWFTWSHKNTTHLYKSESYEVTEKYFHLKHTWPLSSTHLPLTSFKVTRHQTLINVQKALRPPDPHCVCVREIEIKCVWSCKLSRQASNRWEITENQGWTWEGWKETRRTKRKMGSTWIEVMRNVRKINGNMRSEKKGWGWAKKVWERVGSIFNRWKSLFYNRNCYSFIWVDHRVRKTPKRNVVVFLHIDLSFQEVYVEKFSFVSTFNIQMNLFSTKQPTLALLFPTGPPAVCCPPLLTMSSWVVNRKGQPQYRRHFLTDNSVFHGKYNKLTKRIKFLLKSKYMVQR